MHNLQVVFSHGKESGPFGNKILGMAGVAKRLGCVVESIDYRGLDIKARITKLQDYVDAIEQPYVLVGSSMGGFVATAVAARSKPAGLFLLAPALYSDGLNTTELENIECPVEIVHGWRDDIVPAENAIQLAKIMAANLHILNDGHRLRGSVEQVEALLQRFLEVDCIGPDGFDDEQHSLLIDPDLDDGRNVVNQ